VVLRAAADVLAGRGIEPEYLALVDAETFLSVEVLGAAPAILAVAADLGGTRLIDNMPIEPPAAAQS
jgi:pantoate--beta-alanine ligase